VQILEPAELTIWYCAENNSKKDIAMRQIIKEMSENKTFKNVKFESTNYGKKEYEARLKDAADKDQLPSLFESGCLDDEQLRSAIDLRNVLDSEKATECLFIDQYDRYYKDAKRIPLGIEVPVAVAITKSPSAVTTYNKSTFSVISDFGVQDYAIEETAVPLLEKNSFSVLDKQSKDTVVNSEDPSGNSCALLLTTTMHIAEADLILSGKVEWEACYCVKPTFCNFVLEWSSAAKGDNMIAAAERFLSWMLGDACQEYLMISYCADGQIPINKTAFSKKIKTEHLESLDSVKDMLRFER
jgi:hypothetical protein